ncbi:MAG: hypothetical protein FJW40_26135 [Acidobacteria bacterium]|nr:hypothetical protein [Acidobacteriota bacterium]
MQPELELLLSLETLERKALELHREISSLPKQVAAIEKTLESHQRQLEADEAALKGNLSDRKRHEGDIQLQHQKISKLRDQMLGAKTNEQYRAFQHEIEFCEKEIRKHEDRILELMEESEPLAVRVKAAQGSLEAERKVVSARKADAEQRTAADQVELKRALSSRKQLMAQLSPAAVTGYERIVRKWKTGPLVAEVVDGRCGACQLMIRPAHYQILRKGDELVICENCSRFLSHNPPVSLEHEMHQVQP